MCLLTWHSVLAYMVTNAQRTVHSLIASFVGSAYKLSLHCSVHLCMHQVFYMPYKSPSALARGIESCIVPKDVAKHCMHVTLYVYNSIVLWNGHAGVHSHVRTYTSELLYRLMAIHYIYSKTDSYSDL